jgi:hypothetical protein
MKAKALILAGLCGLMVALALPAAGIAASQPTVEPFNSTFGPQPSNLCGIDGTEVITVSGVNVYDGQVWDGINAYHFADTFTNPATGKWVEYVSGVVFKNMFVDNGDGTISLYVWFSGNELIRQSNGGPPIGGILAGHTEGVITFDATTGDLISVQSLFSAGPHPDHSPSQVCDQIVAALT